MVDDHSSYAFPEVAHPSWPPLTNLLFYKSTAELMETWVRSSPSDKADEVIPGSETEQVTCLSVLYSCPDQGLHCFGCSLVFLIFHFCALCIFRTSVT